MSSLGYYDKTPDETKQEIEKFKAYQKKSAKELELLKRAMAITATNEEEAILAVEFAKELYEVVRKARFKF